MNTQDFESVVSQVLAESIPLPRPAMPTIANYCTKLKLPGPIVRGKANLPIVTSVGTVQENPTTFETHNDVVGLADPTLTHFSAQFGFDNPTSANGLTLKMLLASHLTNIEQSIQGVINSQIVTANFQTAVTVSSAAYALANCEALVASVPARTIIALTPNFFAKTKSTWLPSGQENILAELSHVTGMGDFVSGFAARPEAIALIHGYPETGPGNEIKTTFITLPIGVDVQFSRWWTRDKRAWSGSLDICCTAAPGQPGALQLLKSE